MKSEVMASMFTGTSLSACLVRVADRVSLADQPVSRSVAMTKGESSITSPCAVVGLVVGAVCAESPAAAIAVSIPGGKRLKSLKPHGDFTEVMVIGVKRMSGQVIYSSEGNSTFR